MLKIKNLGAENSVLNQFLSEIRSEEIQADSMRFRRNMERMGEIFAYEISKDLNYKEQEIITPLGSATMNLPEYEIVLATILRAGLPLHQGLLNYFDKAANAFISAFRKHDKDDGFTIQMEYVSSPELNDKTLIIADPMLATGASMALTVNELNNLGKPKHTHIVTAIACVDGIDHLKKKIKTDNVTLWTGAIDEELTAKAYIVPGLGDAGDLAFGEKTE